MTRTDLTSVQLSDLLRTMIRIREFESNVEKLFEAGKIPGFTHLSIGQEAVATGVCAALRVDDWLTSTHRGHGHTIAKGAKTDRMMAELFGKRTGYCLGKGGSMHIADFSVGMLGANAIVGGSLPIATGAALSAKIKGTDQVAVAFFGDGASNRGTFHESINFAAVFKLPVIFLCENNGYASTTPLEYGTAVTDIAKRATSYDIPGVIVDGNDVLAVYEATVTAVERARAGEGPTLLEAKTYRWRGHYVGDPQEYRDKEGHKQQVDPIQAFSRYLIEEGVLSPTALEEMRGDIEQELIEAIDFAETSPYPEPEEALNELFLSETDSMYA